MTPEKLQIFRTLLIIAIDKHLAEGGTLISHSFQKDDNKSYCPVYLITEGDFGHLDTVIGKLLDIKDLYEVDRDVWTFIHVFDGVEDRVDPQSPMVVLGRELRAKYITKTKE
jgi:hypothetical protein